MPIPVSVIVLTKNEEAGIAQTLSRLGEFSEVIVVDSHSTDATVLISENAGARVVQFSWDGHYPKKKQWALDNSGAQHDWILLLDADEYPSTELVDEIRGLITEDSSPQQAAFDLTLQYRFAGQFLNHGHKVTKRSLLDRHRTRFPEVDDLLTPGIREVEGHYQPQSKSSVGKIDAPLFHDDKDPVSSWFGRHNRYSDWEAHLRLAPKTRSKIARNRSPRGRLFDKVPFKPLAFFLYGYIFRAGFLDGRPGLDYHIALSAYYWQIDLKTRELRSRDTQKSDQQ